MTDAALTLGGRNDDPAITWRDRTLTYAELARLVAAVPRPPNGVIDTGAPAPTEGGRTSPRSGPPSPRAPSAEPDLLHVLVGVFAAARHRVAVLVRAPVGPLPSLGPLPAGTWLVAQTSGTSGRPRAICRTAASWADSFAPLRELAGLTARDRVLSTGAPSATLHLFAAVHTLAIGAHLTDRPAEATAVHAVPQRLGILLDDLPPTAPLRTAVTAGSPLTEDLAQRCRDRGLAVTEYYGAAELSFVAARRVPDPLRAFPGVDIRVDPDGVLWARSPYLALGYAGDRGGPLTRDRRGFATVGDLAVLSPDGALTIRGRGDAAILTGGHTVLAEEVEAVLGAFPGVAATAVVGVAHPRFGQMVVAVLEPVPGADLSAIPTAARTQLAGAARPRRYLICDRLPRTTGGKIARAAVADGLVDGSLPARPLVRARA